MAMGEFMEFSDAMTDVAADPCAIIRRSTVGAALFFACYAWMGNSQHGFWISLSLGVLGCMASGGPAPIRFYLLLTLAPLLTLDFFAAAPAMM